ncbi:TIGR02217 family protein [Rhodobacteraceae bacterium WD3A24]|nr:TIGR02217 family protein [Rhodobacteraceae bacterium WD3A24]
MAFHEVRFPASLSFGALGGPERRTEIVTLASGHEERNTPWAHGRRRYDAGVGLRSLDDLEALTGFFEARGGQLHGFRWKDWADFRSAPAARPLDPRDQPVGVGDGATTRFRLIKRYRSGGHSYDRPIAKPVAGTVRVALADDEQIEGTQWTLDPVAGEVIFATPPATGSVITAGFEFDVPVRFDTDRIQVSVASFQAGEVPSVPVVEVRL